MFYEVTGLYKSLIVIFILFAIFFVILINKGSSLKSYLKTENTIWFHTLYKWKQPKIDSDPCHFSIHRNSNYFWYFLALLHEQVIEGVVLHIMLKSETHSAVWIITAIHVYSVIYIAGEYNALRNSRVKIGHDRIDFQVGVRRRVEVLYENFEKVERLGSYSDFKDGSDTFQCTAVPVVLTKGFGISDSPNAFIILKQPVIGYGMFGIKKEYAQLSIVLDDPDRFIKLVEDNIKCA